mgnify:CR=1 FL=1
MSDTKTFVDRDYNHARKQAKLEQEEKELAELEAQLKGETTEEEEPQVEEEVTQEEETPVETPEEVEPDPEPITAEEKSFKKRYGDLRRHMQQKEKEWNDRLKALESKGKDVVPPKSDEDLKEWANKYPDVASIVETIATKKAQEMFAKADSRFQELDEAKFEAQRVKAENDIRKAHSDFDDLRESDTFHKWVDEQPKWVQDALYENSDDAASVIRVLDLYKVDNGLTPSAKKEKAKAAAKATPRGTRAAVDSEENSKKFFESQVSKMSDQEFEKNMEAIVEAQRTGNFVYDVTGGAR